MIKIGLGFDSHRFSQSDGKGLTGKAKPLVLGGVNLTERGEDSLGFESHSDGDVVIHALIDALLGALNLEGKEDIGTCFPDTDHRYQGMNSGVLLKEVMVWLDENHYHISNLDCTIISQSVKIAPHRQAIKQQLAQLMQLNTSQIAIKAKTAEKMGALGRSEGMACHCAVLIFKN